MLRPLLLLISIFFISITAFTQKKISSTDSIIVSGELKENRTISLSLLSTGNAQNIGKIIITNHKGEKKSTKKLVKGVPVKKILENLPYNITSPKQLSAFYFAFIASDGYTVVFSWNELFNNPIGEKVYFITQMDGFNLADMPDRILLASTKDITTGGRFVKGVRQIIVGRITE